MGDVPRALRVRRRGQPLFAGSGECAAAAGPEPRGYRVPESARSVRHSPDTAGGRARRHSAAMLYGTGPRARQDPRAGPRSA